MTTWFVKLNNKYIPYATLELASKDISEVFPIGTECVRHECSSLCGYFDCAEVERDYAQCYADLVGATPRDKVRELATLLYSKGETPHSDIAEHCDIDRKIFNLLPTVDEMEAAKKQVYEQQQTQIDLDAGYDEYLASNAFKKADALASRQCTCKQDTGVFCISCEAQAEAMAGCH